MITDVTGQAGITGNLQSSLSDFAGRFNLKDIVAGVI
jgi:hypothetical protein